MDDLKNNTIISKANESPRHAKKRGFESVTLRFQQTRKERQRYENKCTLGVNGQGPKPGPMKKRADYPQAVNKVLVLRRQVENPNSYTLETDISDSDQSRNVKEWKSNGVNGDGLIGPKLLLHQRVGGLPPLTSQPGGHQKSGRNANKLFFFPARCFA